MFTRLMAPVYLAGLLCFLLAGCAYHSARFPLGAPQAAKLSDQVSIVEGAPSRPYEIVGKVHSHCRWNWILAWASCRESTMKSKLEEEAAALGADAVIDVKRDGFSKFEWTDVHYHGVAVRWQ